MTKKPRGIILWQGKSPLDNERIAVIATGIFNKTENHKTGDMIQTYIIRRDIQPIDARRRGKDKSICGDCKHRENSTCYVNLCHGPLAIFYALIDGNYRLYQDSDIEFFRGRSIRIGSYGDPAVIPYEIWDNICSVSKGYTGYTHQWKDKRTDQRLKKYCMASVDSISGYMNEYNQAKDRKWRTFRVRENLDNEIRDDEFICPASKEGGEKNTCNKCNLCCGSTRTKGRNPVIVIHADSEAMGSMWRKDRYMAIMKKIKNKKKWRRDYKAEDKAYKKICKF